MRPHLLLSLLLLSACRGGMSAELHVEGQIEGKPIDMDLQLGSGGGYVLSATQGDDLAVAPQQALIGGQVAYTRISARTCPLDPCPDAAQLILRTPPPLIYAGPWTLGSDSLFTLNEDITPVLGAELQGYVLDFAEPEFSSSGEEVMSQWAKMSSPEGAPTRITGEVELVYKCEDSSQYFRHCGEPKLGDGQANPAQKRYIEDTCPRELVAPYEAPPKWSGERDFSLGDMEIECRVTREATGAVKEQLLCYSKRSGVKAEGCEWTVHFLSDGMLYQFALAAFAEGECPRKTCNTYR